MIMIEGLHFFLFFFFFLKYIGMVEGPLRCLSLAVSEVK